MLKIGLLWFDDDPKRPVVAKLDEAVERYEERFGSRPTLVYLHPAQAEGIIYRRLSVRGDASLRRNHFLIGVDDADPVEPVLAGGAAAPAPAAVGAAAARAAPEAVGVAAIPAEAGMPRRARAAGARKSPGEPRRLRASRAS